MPLSFQPMPLSRRPRPFNHPEWLFELKYDGFRALARVERSKCQLISRNGHQFPSFSDLADSMARSLPSAIVLDGEIVCLDRKGRPQFSDLLFRRGKPCFFAFDLLYADGKDWRRDSLVDRKATLKQMIHRLPADSRLKYADHVEGSGVALFERVCKLDLEGIVGKYKFGPYGADGNAINTWYKIRNRNYSQMVGRDQLFERDRHKEPVPGWHCCELACAEVDQNV
jgi:bifunctional non-homologous end joining protein LigD